jgi:hypothetical protein
MASEQYRFALKVETDTMVANAALALALYDVERGELWSFADVAGYEPISNGIEIALMADELIVHSDYALKTLERLYGVTFDRKRVIDTLKAAEALRGRGGNSIATWADRLKIGRDPFRGADRWSPFVQKHAERDAQIISRVLDRLLESQV